MPVRRRPVRRRQRHPASQTPTFKLQVDFVEVDAIVTDARGNYVRDLKKEDFQIFEDGKPQAITNFAPIDIPIERGERPLFAKAPVEPDVQSNERPFSGRVYVMVLDSAHTLPQNTNLVRRAAKRFIDEKLGSNDLMAVVTARGVAGGDAGGQEFTNNRRLLDIAVDKFRGTQPRSATLNKIDDVVDTAPIRAATRAAGGTPQDPQDMDAKEREFNARAVLEELTAVADWFASVHGRKKSILFFSEGISYDIHDVFANGGNNAAVMIQTRMQDLVRATTKANAVIYTIDPRGLQGLSDGSIELTSVGPGENLPELSERGLQNESRLARESLQNLAGETGGFAIVNSNGFANNYDRIVQENSSYYMLAYYPPESETGRQVPQHQRPRHTSGADRSLSARLRESIGQGPGAFKERSVGRDGRHAAEPDSCQRSRDEGVRRAVQGHRAERVGASGCRAARARSAHGRERQDRARLLGG